MARYKDFDEALEELEPISFRVNGKTYKLPKEPSASAMLRMLRGGVPDDPTDLLKELVGDENYDKMNEGNGLTLRQLQGVTEFIVNACLGTSEDEDGGNGASPSSPSSRSSKRGAS